LEFDGQVITRKAVSSSTSQADLDTYAVGVRRMRDLPDSDPLSWYYQSRMHGNPMATERTDDEPEDFSQCQHGTWWFLPWHRMYLLQFERIIAHVTQTPAFALPYWDYPSPAEAVVPPAFLDPASPLFDDTRRFPAIPIFPQPWVRAATFELLAGAAVMSHLHRGNLPGLLEQYPHNTMHGAVGGDMAGFQSPLDPLFWIHHCNIDRLWESWRRLPGHANPDSEAWLDSVFEFPDPIEERRRMSVGQIATPEAADYEYDEPRLLVRRSELVPRLAFMQGPTGDAGGDEFEWLDDVMDGADGALHPLTDEGLELIGANATGNTVRDSVDVVPEVPVQASARPEGARASEDPEPLTLLLRLENVGIDGGDASDMWSVYAAVGDGERHLVGAIVPFGLAGLTGSGGRQTLTFDVSGLATELAVAPQGSLRVTFEPVDENATHEPYWERTAIYRAGG
jgi:tyrosinase